jgi:hypothetical protein
MAGTSKSGASRKGSDDNKDDKSKGSSGKDRSKSDPVDSARRVVATVIWVLAVVAALLLAAGALVIALDFNEKNRFVDFLTTTAENLNFLGEMKSFEPDGKSEAAQHSALVKEVLVNWGICAVVYLVIGKVLDRLIRP